MKVLVVDDSMMIRVQVSKILAAAGFEPIDAVDGLDALDKVKEHDVALVICDVTMPRMGGLDFLEELRKDERFKTLAAVMLTTEAQSDLVARSKSLGAKGWIIKPFKPDLLVAAARKLTAAPAKTG